MKSIGEGVTSLANGLGQIGQFSVDVMTNNPRSLETGAQAGESIGKTLVGGVRLFQMSHDYLYNVGFTGEYAKPFNDIANLGNELNRRWQEMPTKERAKIAAKLSTETLASMAIPLGADKLAKTEKVTELMEEFAAAAKTLGKESRAVDAIEETVDTLSKKGVKAIDVDGYEVFDKKRPIHDRRHLQDLEELEILSQKAKPIKITNKGASPEFERQLTEHIENLDPHEKIFLSETDVEVVACEMVKDHVPEVSEATAGIWFEKENRIYIPEKVFSRNRRNPAPEFHLRNEFGHAFNDHSIFRENEFSKSKGFKNLFSDAYNDLSEEDLQSLPFSSNRDNYEKLLKKDLMYMIPTTPDMKYLLIYMHMLQVLVQEQFTRSY